MMRLFFGLLIFSSLTAHAQQYSMSLGIYTGIAVPFTMDQGINNDPRYRTRYSVKFAPIGLSYSMDYEHFGILFTPGIVNIGQSSFAVNNVGGQIGIRHINLTYAQLPIGIKYHVIDLSFFRVSAVAAVGAAYLVNGKETITHEAAKIKFPTTVYPILPSGYTIEYDGVRAPAVKDYPMLQKQDFNPLQIFVSGGFRSDWDISNHWRLSFDFRVNYGIREPRTAAYIDKVKANQTLYDLPGIRRDLYAQLSVGMARYLEFEKSDRDRKKRLKGKGQVYSPKKRSHRRPKSRG